MSNIIKLTWMRSSLCLLYQVWHVNKFFFRNKSTSCWEYSVTCGQLNRGDIDNYILVQRVPILSSDGHVGALSNTSPRFLCRSTALYIFARAVGRQRAIHTENSGFASSTLGHHISTFRGYRILFSIRNPYLNRFTNHFSIHS